MKWTPEHKCRKCFCFKGIFKRWRPFTPIHNAQTTKKKKKATQHLLSKFTIASVPDLITFLESRTCTLLFSHRPWWLQGMLGTTPTVPGATLFSQCLKTDRTALNSGTTHRECSLRCYWESELISHLVYKYYMNYTTKVLLTLYVRKEEQPAKEQKDIPNSQRLSQNLKREA